jgi:hypothetical protein
MQNHFYRVTGNRGRHDKTGLAFVVHADSPEAAAAYAKDHLAFVNVTSVEAATSISKAEKAATVARARAVEKALAAVAY